MGDFTEQRFDYSGGRDNAPELVVMVGISGSGKSTVAKSWINWGKGQVVRFNRDSMRAMMYVDAPWETHRDDLVRVLEKEMARTALKMGKDVVIDDTNCVRRTRAVWETLAQETHVRLRIVTMTTPVDVCIERDAARPGKESVGKNVILRQRSDLKKLSMGTETNKQVLTRPVFEKEALLNGGWTTRLPGAKWAIVDVDGTLANHEGVRNPYDEGQVLLDNPYPVVVDWVKALYPTHNVLIVSGRKERCGDDTCDWFELQGVPFDHILMRATSDNRSDEFVKKDLLDMILTVVAKEDIALILDDRPKVIRMWKLFFAGSETRVFPVRGAVEEF
jgi:predicted kinase